MSNLESTVEQQTASLDELNRNIEHRTIALFDLSDSTAMKRTDGHQKGIRSINLHNGICREIALNYDGRIIKELGDGILTTFDNSIDACLAACNAVVAISLYTSFSTKVALTSGEIEKVTIEGNEDVLGSTIDKCAKILGEAGPNEILLDAPMEDTVKSYVNDFYYLDLEGPNSSCLPGFGETEIYVLTIPNLQLTIYENGRRPFDEKVEFAMDATQDIIELGIGLTSFSEYFYSRRSSDFRDRIGRLLDRGVDLKCMLIDPDSDTAESYSNKTGETGYIEEIRRSLDRLREEKEKFDDQDLAGNFEIYLYNDLPYYHAAMVDKNSPQGKVYISHYMHNTARSESPGMAFSKLSNPTMFETYKNSIESLIEESESVSSH